MPAARCRQPGEPAPRREGAGEDRERDEVGQRQAHAAHGAAREQHARPGEPASPVPNGQQTPEQCREQEPESRVEERVDVDNPRWAAQSNHVGKGRCENASGAIGRTPQARASSRRCQRRVVGDLCVGQAVVATSFVDIHRQRLERIDLSSSLVESSSMNDVNPNTGCQN
jgi:hypothetical protein